MTNVQASTRAGQRSTAEAKQATVRAIGEIHQVEVKAVKRDLYAHVRGDWEWPMLTSSEPHITRISHQTQWRERDANSPSPSPTVAADPYRFENPDSFVEEMVSRKRKRRRLLVDEMSWNKGLRTFVERRNGWTGGKLVPSPDEPEAMNCIEGLSEESNITMVELCPLPEPLIPPTNAARASIGPSTYPTIYNKVIVQSITPNIPINLATMTAALVEGWKATGEWPPRLKALEPLAGRRRKHAEGNFVKDSVGMVKRVLGLNADKTM